MATCLQQRTLSCSSRARHAMLSCAGSYDSNRRSHQRQRRAFSACTSAFVDSNSSACSTSGSSTRLDDNSSLLSTRREALALLASAPLLQLLAAPAPARAVQGLTAGRVPGISTTPDEDGFFTYTRPEGKSGGHGVGWSEIPQYSFRVPPGWQEKPVSIADLGGTEIDLRYGSKEEGGLEVVVAPVLRFKDVGYNADVRIEELGSLDSIIAGFAPEIFGVPLDEGSVVDSRVVDKGGLKFYEWEVKPRHLVAATAVKNRLFILAVSANSRQWKKHEGQLRKIQQSFMVPPA